MDIIVEMIAKRVLSGMPLNVPCRYFFVRRSPASTKCQAVNETETNIRATDNGEVNGLSRAAICNGHRSVRCRRGVGRLQAATRPESFRMTLL